jgi:hypothetical protein
MKFTYSIIMMFNLIFILGFIKNRGLLQFLGAKTTTRNDGRPPTGESHGLLLFLLANYPPFPITLPRRKTLLFSQLQSMFIILRDWKEFCFLLFFFILIFNIRFVENKIL